MIRRPPRSTRTDTLFPYTTRFRSMAVAMFVAMLIIALSPIQDVTAELRARTQPTLLDLGVAVVGGVAGVYAIMRKLSGVMVGVAIATALVPPLSTRSEEHTSELHH